MPELPEVETIRRGLEREVVGKRIKTVEVTGLRSIRRHKTKKEFIARLEGAKVKTARRRGKYLVLALDTGEVLVIHLRMSGQLRRAQPKDPLEQAHPRRLTFTQGGQLRFVDPRTFGEMFVTAPDEPRPPSCPSSPTSASTRSTSRCRSPSSPGGCSAGPT